MNHILSPSGLQASLRRIGNKIAMENGAQERHELPDGTIVHIQGLPFRIVGHATLEGANWGLLQDDERTGFIAPKIADRAG